MEYKYGVQAWITIMDYKYGLQVWITSMEYKYGVQVWSTSMEYKYGEQVWRIDSICVIGTRVLADSRLKVSRTHKSTAGR